MEEGSLAVAAEREAIALSAASRGITELEERLLVAEGRIEREMENAEVPIVHLIVRRLTDRSDLLDGISRADLTTEWAERSIGRADEVRRPDPGSQGVKLPPTRDFR